MKKIKYMAALLICAGIANATVITPTSVTYSGTATVYAPLSNADAIIDGSGLSDTPTDANLPIVTHNNDSGTATWVTEAPNGSAGDWFDPAEGTVVMEFDLGATYANIDTFVSWPYHGAGNSISSVDLYFSADGGTTTNSIQTVAVPLTDGAHGEILAITPVAANHVIMVVTDNHFGNVATGGDRAGIGEIRFVDSYVPPTVVTSFTATPSVVLNGGTTTLAWVTANADTLSLNQGIGDVTGLTSMQLVVSGETTYTLTASGPNGSTNESVTVFIQGDVPGIIIQPMVLLSEEDVFNSAENTINNERMVDAVNNGDSLASALLATHAFDGNYQGSYASTARNGGASGSFFDGSGEDPVNLVYDLTTSGDIKLDGIVLWAYGNSGGSGANSGNALRTLEVRVNTEVEGANDFSGTAATMITLFPVHDGDTVSTNDLGGINSAQYFALPSQNGRYVQVSLTGNYHGLQEISGGGDRVGLGEVRFVSGSSYVAGEIGNIMITGPVAITGGQGMVLSWSTGNGQKYDVQYKNDLILDSDWTTFTNVTGTGGGITVTSAVDNATKFYQVETPAL